MEQHPADRHLIAGCEEGRLDVVGEALQYGADPKARKQVTIRVRVAAAKTMRRRSIFGLKDYKEEPQETRVDTRMGESAIALAIRSYAASKGVVVRKLLEAGCNPNDPIEWSIPGYRERWTEDDWHTRRWNERETFRYPSALDLALTAGEWNFNKFGAHVTTNNPSSPEDVCDGYYLTPNLQIVEVLLEHGARITDSVLARARELRDGQNSKGVSFPPRPGFLVLLESRLVLQKHSLSARPEAQSPRHNGYNSPGAPSPPVIPVRLPSEPQLTTRRSESHLRNGALPSPARSRRTPPPDAYPGDDITSIPPARPPSENGGPRSRSTGPGQAAGAGHRRTASQAPRQQNSSKRASQYFEDHPALPGSIPTPPLSAASYKSPSRNGKHPPPGWNQGKGQEFSGNWSMSSNETISQGSHPGQHGWQQGGPDGYAGDFARQNEQLREQVETLTQENKDLREKLERRNSRLMEMKKENSNAATHIEELEDELDEQRRRVADLDLEVKGQAETIQALQAQLERLMGPPAARSRAKSRGRQ
ncbi:hypothetical protein M427DRAFT_27884 [Gonapodya prolifera JEL478]|uniref:Ankyrin n=1 Tax=Gonapodya prolifera (strain JEL478) TaxID=1344416 RepID=A0A139AVM7_GONPJ|nr:hypothetical protein M427DRAFT_27884 [Gonapodya prolifera JEL478]|eukprot:KXS20791.1 hypothetical protein M427DRAFT_27884 [Gonapodya prolifera JEL478]